VPGGSRQLKKGVVIMQQFTKHQLINACRELTGSVGDEGRTTKQAYIDLLTAKGYAPSDISAAIGSEPMTTKPAPKPITKPSAKVDTAKTASDADKLAALLSGMVKPAIDADQINETVNKAIDERLKELDAPVKTLIIHNSSHVELSEHTHPAFDECLLYAGLRQAIMLVGPAGTGKTFLAQQVAKSLAMPFASISCTVGMSESALTGRLIPTGEGGKFEYQESDFIRLYEKGGVFLFDEMDAADANVMMLVNQALANGGFFVSHRTGKTFVKRHPDFVCIGAANTFGNGGNIVYAGRERLDAATLDRFEQLPVGYDKEFEDSISVPEIRDFAWNVRARIETNRLRRVMSTRRIIAMSQQFKAGLPLETIKARYFASWSEDEKRKVS